MEKLKAAPRRTIRRGSWSYVTVVHPDGTRSRIRVPTRSMNERVREEALEDKHTVRSA